MSAAANTQRLERKFLVEELDLHEVKALVKLHPALFRRAFPPRWVNNIYFDSPNALNYYDNVDGATFRAKARIRWYGDGRDGKAKLELKLRSGLVGTKEICKLASFDPAEHTTRAALKELFAASDLSEGARVFLDGQTPVLRNRYRREYYRTADGKFRLTLDSQLSFRPFEGTHTEILHKERPVVVELKYEIGDDAQASSIAGRFPFRMTKNSKYVTGLEAAYALHGRQALPPEDVGRVGHRAGVALVF